MLLQTNSYIVPKERRAEHARLIRRFRQALARIGCDQFEVYEQVGANWSPGGANGRYVQIMRFRDRQHQQAVQVAEANDHGAQQIIAEFCDLINFPYQQQHGYFATGFYTSVLPTGPRQSVEHEAAQAEEETGDAGAPVAANPFTGGKVTAVDSEVVSPASDEADHVAPHPPSDGPSEEVETENEIAAQTEEPGLPSDEERELAEAEVTAFSLDPIVEPVESKAAAPLHPGNPDPIFADVDAPVRPTPADHHDEGAEVDAFEPSGATPHQPGDSFEPLLDFETMMEASAPIAADAPPSMAVEMDILSDSPELAGDEPLAEREPPAEHKAPTAHEPPAEHEPLAEHAVAAEPEPSFDEFGMIDHGLVFEDELPGEDFASPDSHAIAHHSVDQDDAPQTSAPVQDSPPAVAAHHEPHEELLPPIPDFYGKNRGPTGGDTKLSDDSDLDALLDDANLLDSVPLSDVLEELPPLHSSRDPAGRNGHAAPIAEETDLLEFEALIRELEDPPAEHGRR